MAAISTTIPNTWTETGFTGGVTAVAGRGPTYNVVVDGAWTIGDSFAFQVILPAQTYDFGTGRVTGLVPTSAVTLNERVHFVAGIYWCGSDNDDCTAWEQQAPGAFKIPVANQVAQNENLLSLCPFQGRMAVASRNTITLWGLDANPTNIALIQTISNMGTVGPFAMQSLGDFDVLFPSDSGVRSLRVMTINLNGFITDIGSPIDTLIKAAILNQTTAQLIGACAIVDPQNKSYWLYLPSVNKVYMLSYFPSAKITAWSVFNPTIPGGIQFNISTFKVFGANIYYRANCINNTVLAYGFTGFIGSYGAYKAAVANNAYDITQPTFTLPWNDLKKAGVRKTLKGIDVVIQGQWTVKGSMDFNGVNNGAALKTVANQLNKLKPGIYASAQSGLLSWTDSGYHVQVGAVADDPTEVWSSNAIFSELVLYYEGGDEKP